MRMRLPLRLFLSYAAVAIIGAVVAYLTVRLVLQSHLGKVPTGPVVALTGPVLVAAAPF